MAKVWNSLLRFFKSELKTVQYKKGDCFGSFEFPKLGWYDGIYTSRSFLPFWHSFFELNLEDCACS